MKTLALAVFSLLISGCVIAPNIGLLNGPGKSAEQVVEKGDANKILLLDIHGLISSTPPSSLLGLGSGISTLAAVDSALKRAAKDKKIKALLLHINSPGGGVTASDDVYARIRDFADERKIPVIAALADVAASGGYYIACAADEVVMHPTGITGSIGVILTRYEVSGLMEKVGVRDETIHAGRLKTLLTPSRPATEEESQIAQQLLDSMHQRFISVVRSGRPALQSADLSHVADGRIFTAKQALALGLIDRIGRLSDAVDIARELSGSKNAKVVRYNNAGIAGDSIYARMPANQQATLQSLLPPTGSQAMYVWPAGL